MTSIFTPREFQNYCYVVKCRDGNEYDVGVFMTFDGLKKYFKEYYFYSTNSKYSLLYLGSYRHPVSYPFYR